MKGGALPLAVAAVAAYALAPEARDFNAPAFLRRPVPAWMNNWMNKPFPYYNCKICNRIWKGHKDWIWKPALKKKDNTLEDTSLVGLNYNVYVYNYQLFGARLQDHPYISGVCGYCNGNNMYNKLISEGEHKVTAKIEVILFLCSFF